MRTDYTLTSSRGTISNNRLVTCGKFCHIEFYLTLTANAPANTTIVTLNKYTPNTRAVYSILYTNGSNIYDGGFGTITSSGGILTTQTGFTSGYILIISSDYSLR